MTTATEKANTNIPLVLSGILAELKQQKGEHEQQNETEDEAVSKDAAPISEMKADENENTQIAFSFNAEALMENKDIGNDYEANTQNLDQEENNIQGCKVRQEENRERNRRRLRRRKSSKNIYH